MLISVLAVMAALQAAPAATTPAAPVAEAPAASAAESAAMTQAKANRALIKYQPELKDEKRPEYPDSEKAKGNGGTVYVSGIIDVDGRIKEATVARSNAGPVLSAAWLKAVQGSTFNSARDAGGAAIPVVATLPYTFTFEDIRPDTITRAEAVYGDAEKASGANGKVTIGGMVGADGHLKDAKVLVSSKSPGLDQSALEAAQRSVFRVYVDSDGKPLEQPVRTTYGFSSYRSPGADGGILRYHCEAFAREQTWWRANWPVEERGELYSMFVGLGTMSRLELLTVDAAALKAYLKDLEVRWVAAIETCKSKPDALLIDVLKPEGDFARRAAERAK